MDETLQHDDEEADRLDWRELLLGTSLANGQKGEPGGYTFRAKYPSTLFGPAYEGEFRLPRGMYGKGGRIYKMAQLIMEGRSMRAIRREVGGSTNTIVKLRRVIEILRGDQVLCACGQPARHQGFCEWRIAQSESRQRYLAECAAKTAARKTTADTNCCDNLGLNS